MCPQLYLHLVVWRRWFPLIWPVKYLQSLTSVRCLSFSHSQVHSRFIITVVKPRVTRQQLSYSQRLVHRWNINPFILLYFMPVFAPCWKIICSKNRRTVQNDCVQLWSNKSGCFCTQQTKQGSLNIPYKMTTHIQEKVSGCVKITSWHSRCQLL